MFSWSSKEEWWGGEQKNKKGEKKESQDEERKLRRKSVCVFQEIESGRLPAGVAATPPPFQQWHSNWDDHLSSRTHTHTHANIHAYTRIHAERSVKVLQ